MQHRIHRNVEIMTESGCWIWMAALMNEGYGIIEINKEHALAHRVSYETFVGPIPEGLHIDHLCRVRCCVNPKHLEPVTCAENLRRGIVTTEAARKISTANRKMKTHCPHGHQYTAENTRVYRGSRFCRACNTLQSKQRRLACHF